MEVWYPLVTDKVAVKRQDIGDRTGQSGASAPKKWKKNKITRSENTTVSVCLPIYLLLPCDLFVYVCMCARGARCHIDWLREAAHSGFVVLNLHQGIRK